MYSPKKLLAGAGIIFFKVPAIPAIKLVKFSPSLIDHIKGVEARTAIKPTLPASTGITSLLVPLPRGKGNEPSTLLVNFMIFLSSFFILYTYYT
ncbi:uncharacterized protein METZ01_LOCUS357473, partial [marine metagenome]